MSIPAGQASPAWAIQDVLQKVDVDTVVGMPGPPPRGCPTPRLTFYGRTHPTRFPFRPREYTILRRKHLRSDTWSRHPEYVMESTGIRWRYGAGRMRLGQRPWLTQALTRAASLVIVTRQIIEEAR